MHHNFPEEHKVCISVHWPLCSALCQSFPKDLLSRQAKVQSQPPTTLSYRKKDKKSNQQLAGAFKMLDLPLKRDEPCLFRATFCRGVSTNCRLPRVGFG